MKTMRKRVLSILLTLCMVAGMMPMMGVEVEAASRWYDGLVAQLKAQGKWKDDPLEDIITIMKSQEGKTDAQLGYGTDWCALFAWDCASLAGIPHIRETTGSWENGTYYSYASNWFGNMYRNDGFEGALFTNVGKYNSLWWTSNGGNGSYSRNEYKFIDSNEYTPQRGDFIFVLIDGYQYIGHVAVVIDYDKSKGVLRVVHGNWGDEVQVGTEFQLDCSDNYRRICGYTRVKSHNHTYNKYGVCTYSGCGAKVDFSQYTGSKTVTLPERGTFKPDYQAMSGQYMPKGKDEVTIWKAPYDKSGAVGKLAPKQPVKVTGKFWNGVGNKDNHIWYTVDDGSGEVRYMYSSYLTPYVEPPVESTLKVSLQPKSISIDPYGNSGITGSITSDYYEITQYYAMFNNSDLAFYSTGAGKWGKIITFNADSPLNQRLREELKKASFVNKENYITVTAWDAKGAMKSDTIRFTIDDTSLKEPEITYDHSEHGAVYYRVSNPNSAGTLSWSCNGTPGSGTSVKVTADSTIQATVTDGSRKAVNEERVTRNRTLSPEINIEAGPSGAQLTLRHSDNKAKLWYQINGSEARLFSASGSGGKIPLSSGCTVTAWATQNGAWVSEKAQSSYTPTAPAAPQIKLVGTSADIPEGRTFTVGWDKDKTASDYTVYVYRNGELDYSDIVSGTQAAKTIRASEAGEYTVRVVASNAFGSSAVSNEIHVTAHAPVTVTIKTDNGTLIEAPKTIEWGSDLDVPIVPARKGYTFAGWSRDFTGFKEDTTVIAKYQINTYTVSFYNADGKTLLGSQRIQFGHPIDSPAMEAMLGLPDGYSFAGWHISQCDPDSDQNLSEIDCNMSLVATKLWTAHGSVVLSIESATRNALNTGYNVVARLSSPNKEDLKSEYQKVKLIATLENEDGQMLGAEIVTRNLTAADCLMDPADPDRVSMFISYNGAAIGKNYMAARVRLSAVGVDGNDHTGGLLGEAVSVKPTSEVKMSGWMDADTLRSNGKSETDADVISKTQYRYYTQTRSTISRTNTTGTAPSLSGYTLVSTNSAFPSWPADPQWSDNFIAATYNRDVATRQVLVTPEHTEYRYGRWSDGYNNSYCRAMGAYYNGSAYSSWHEEYTGWMTSPYVVQNYWYCYGHIGTADHSHPIYNSSSGADNWRGYYPSGASVVAANRWFWEETRTVPASYKTQYAYRDRVYTYSYEKWESADWSEWSDNIATGYADTDFKRIVETRVLYSYQTNDTAEDAIPSKGVKRNCSGKVSLADEDLNGKIATVLVYKETNSDPTEPQLEYVGSTTIGPNNSLDFDYWTKEEPDFSTGDFIIALAIEGASNVVNVDKVFVPRKYTVTFYDESEKVVSEQTDISAGEAAQMVTPPESAGQYFVRWDKDFSSVHENMKIRPVYWPKQYSVAFVDFENATATLRTDYRYGDVLLTPEEPMTEGMEFIGWEIISNDTDETKAVLKSGESDELFVDEDLIAVAQWKPAQYTVTFMNAFGDVLETQRVNHGEMAELPDLGDIPAGMEYLGWATDVAWWNVTEDMIVYPIIAYLETAVAPTSSIASQTAGIYETLELTAPEGTTIYYTLDGSAPAPDRVADEDAGDESADKTTLIYCEPVVLNETTHIRAMSHSAGKNDSEIVDIVFTYDASNEGKISSDSLVEIGTYNMIVEPGQTVTLNFAIDGNPGLAAYEFVVDADPAVFSVLYDEDSLAPLIDEGGVCADKGTLLLGDYQEGIGWQILWFGTSAVKENGSLCTLKLRIEDDAEAGTYPVKVSYSASNTFSEDYFEQDLTGNVSVGMLGNVKLLGDVNGDGAVTTIDVVRIARYLIDDITFTKTQLAAADVTGDGKVTASDVIRLARYLVGLAELN